MNRHGNNIDLWKEFFVTDFKLRYKHSTLGLLWVIFKPLALFTVLYFVWSSLFKTGPEFALYLLLGVITINFFNEGINFGLQALFNKAHIIMKINFPREVVVFSSVSIAVINFVINLVIFSVFAAFGSLHTNLEGLLLAFVSLLSLLLIILGISLFLSIQAVKFHDIRHLVELLLQLVFWSSPVIYQLEVLPETMRNLVLLNPLTHILSLLRTGILNASHITPELWGNAIVLLFASLLLTFIGHLFFNSKIRKIAEYI